MFNKLKMMFLRKSKINYMNKRKKDNIFIDDTVFFEHPNHVTLADNIYIGSQVKVFGCGYLTVSEGTFIGFQLMAFTSEYELDSNSLPYDVREIPEKIKIGKNVWFGGNVTITKGVQIGEGSIIESGSVVSKDVPARSIVRGNPAEIIQILSEELYEKSVSEGKFDYIGKYRNMFD